MGGNCTLDRALFGRLESGIRTGASKEKMSGDCYAATLALRKLLTKTEKLFAAHVGTDTINVLQNAVTRSLGYKTPTPVESLPLFVAMFRVRLSAGGGSDDRKRRESADFCSHIAAPL